MPGLAGTPSLLRKWADCPKTGYADWGGNFGAAQGSLVVSFEEKSCEHV
jgi:hypothetical protein